MVTRSVKDITVLETKGSTKAFKLFSHKIKDNTPIRHGPRIKMKHSVPRLPRTQAITRQVHSNRRPIPEIMRGHATPLSQEQDRSPPLDAGNQSSTAVQTVPRQITFFFFHLTKDKAKKAEHSNHIFFVSFFPLSLPFCLAVSLREGGRQEWRGEERPQGKGEREWRAEEPGTERGVEGRDSWT